MLQGMIPVDSHKSIHEIEEEEKAVFSFPENLADRNSRWSATSMAAVNSFLESEGTPEDIQDSQLLGHLAQFNVHSGPEVLLNIGKMCLKAEKFADLAIVSLKEYLIAVTYQKMFTMNAGLAIED